MGKMYTKATAARNQLPSETRCGTSFTTCPQKSTDLSLIMLLLLPTYHLKLLNLSFLLGHTQQCSWLITGSVLRDDFLWNVGNHIKSSSASCKTINVPIVLSF